MESAVVGDFVRKEIGDWDDEAAASARFKAFSGQRSDWEGRYLFWKDLIVRVARHLRIFIISPSQVKNKWFNRGALIPLCLDDVLFLMYNEGDIVRSKQFSDPKHGRVSRIFQKMIHMMARSTPSDLMLEDHLIIFPVLKDKADEVVKLLSESHWTSSCVITTKKLQELSGGSMEASVILSYLSGCGKAHYLTTNKKEFIEGVKISLSSASVSTTASLDSDVLHLIWTTEKLQQRLDVIDRRYEISRKLALASLSSGKKQVALRHVRELKLVSVSREKCVSFLNRVEEVLNIIGNAESTKKVSEAIQIGARAMKEKRIEVEEVQLCLQELDDSIDSQRQIDDALESSSSYPTIEDEDIEEEFSKLELEVNSPKLPVPVSKAAEGNEPEKVKAAAVAESLSDALSSLKLRGREGNKLQIQNPALMSSSNQNLEAA